MMNQRTFFVGDVHGCFEELLLLLKKAGWNADRHKLILLGDLINKGPDSLKVLSYIRNLKNAQPLKGNHELKAIQALEGKEPLSPSIKKLKTNMGSQWKKWLFYMKSWPIYVEEADFLAVHGGIVPDEHPRQSDPQYLTNIRYWGGKGKNMNNPEDPAWHELYTGSKLVVYAHWAKQGLKIKENSIGLDTGCVYGGVLSGLWLNERELVQVPSLRNVYK